MRMSNHIPTEISVQEPISLQEHEKTMPLNRTNEEEANNNDQMNENLQPLRLRQSSISEVFARSINVF